MNLFALSTVMPFVLAGTSVLLFSPNAICLALVPRPKGNKRLKRSYSAAMFFLF